MSRTDGRTSVGVGNKGAPRAHEECLTNVLRKKNMNFIFIDFDGNDLIPSRTVTDFLFSTSTELTP